MGAAGLPPPGGLPAPGDRRLLSGERPRVGIVVPGFAASDADWCIPPQTALLRELARHAELEVHALRYPHRRGGYTAHGVAVTAWGGADVRGPRRLLHAAGWVRGVARAVRAGRLELLHAFFAHEPAAVASLAGRLTGVPVLVSVLGGELVALPDIGYGGRLTPVGRALVRAGLSGATRTIVMNGSAATRLAAFGWTREPPAVLPLGIDATRFRSEPAGGDRHLDGDPPLLAVASLVPVKDHETLLHAFARVLTRHPGAVLHLAGDGPLRRTLERRARELVVAARVRFHGQVDHDALPGWYRAAELLLVSSLHEGLPTVALEALACGTPVVGTAVGVLPERAGCVSVPVEDAAALAAAVSALLDDPTRRSALAAEGLAAAPRDSLAEGVRALLELWSSTIARSRRD